MSALADDPRAPGLDAYLGELEDAARARRSAAYRGVVAEVGAEALAAGGKRLRPLLVFLSAPPGSEPPRRRRRRRRARPHGDARPRRPDRRRRACVAAMPSAWSAHGAEAARAAGDYLFARAFAELAATATRSASRSSRTRRSASRAARRCSAASARSRHDDRGVPRALRAEDREALRGRVPARRRRRGGRSGSRSASPSRSPTTSSTARARRSRPARSPAPICARGRRRCRSSSPRSGTRPFAQRSRAGPARGCARARRRDRRARASPARWRSTTLARLARASNGELHREELEVPDARRREPGALADGAARPHRHARARSARRCEAGERLDFDDGVDARWRRDDLLALGELADLARRLRGGDDERLLRPEPLPEPDERLPREVQVLRVRRDAEAGATPTRSRPTSSSRTRSRQHELTGFTEIHMVSGENPHVDFELLRRHRARAARGAAGRAPEAATPPPRSTT